MNTGHHLTQEFNGEFFYCEGCQCCRTNYEDFEDFECGEEVN